MMAFVNPQHEQIKAEMPVVSIIIFIIGVCAYIYFDRKSKRLKRRILEEGAIWWAESAGKWAARLYKSREQRHEMIYLVSKIATYDVTQDNMKFHIINLLDVEKRCCELLLRMQNADKKWKKSK